MMNIPTLNIPGSRSLSYQCELHCNLKTRQDSGSGTTLTLNDFVSQALRLLDPHLRLSQGIFRIGTDMEN
jgi:hypothetical protein